MNKFLLVIGTINLAQAMYFMCTKDLFGLYNLIVGVWCLKSYEES